MAGVRKKRSLRGGAAGRPRDGRNELPPTYQAMRRRVERAFRFLVRDHGYSGPELFYRSPQFDLRYRKGDRAVFLLSEYFQEPWVQIRPPRPDERFGLNEAIAVLAPESWTAHPPRKSGGLDADEAAAWIEYYAAFLKQHAREIIDDHASVFARVQAWRAAGGTA